MAAAALTVVVGYPASWLRIPAIAATRVKAGAPDPSHTVEPMI